MSKQILYNARTLVGYTDGPDQLLITISMNADTTDYDDLIREAHRQAITPIAIGIGNGAMFPIHDGVVKWDDFTYLTTSLVLGVTS